MIRNPKLHVISPDGETVFRHPISDAGVAPREEELIIPPGSEEEFRVTTVEHVFSEAADMDSDAEVMEYDHDIYVETADPSDN